MTELSKTLMVQGTTSDAGKSVLVAALCRAIARRGLKVAPFKPQNMALNSAVTPDGREIGRAQAVQARACGLPAHSDMNPVLLKPNSDTGAQVIVHGKALSNMEAADYHAYKRTARQAVLDSHARLKQQYTYIVVEGAGSPAEINLRNNDIANMGFAEAVDCPVILIADIDRGGVFAHLIGTLALLSETERARVKGFVINRFRGDIALLQSGLDWLEDYTGKPVIGVLPYLHDLHLEAEDAINADQQLSKPVLRIAVPVLPRTSNHTDFDALRMQPDVDLQFVRKGQPLPPSDLVILPGSKSVRADLQALRDNGWTEQLARHLRYGGKVLGICGGFQMLGKAIHDPLGIEGAPGSSEGLNWLDMETTLAAEKTLRQVSGHCRLNGRKASLRGYEIHAGVTEGSALENAFAEVNDHCDGAISSDGQVLGSYVHGLFDDNEARALLLHWAGASTLKAVDYDGIIETNLERLADCVEQHLNMEMLLSLGS